VAFVSEYAIGDHGWMLSVLFLCLALGCVSACVALRPHIRTTRGRIGAAFLLLAAAALVTAAFNDIDPITATPVPIGWPNRLVIVAYCVRLTVVT
jgi:hypothetical protein